MKYSIPLKDFFEYTGIDYREDCFDLCNPYEWQEQGISEILYHLPAKYTFTMDDLSNNYELHHALSNALNRANDTAIIDAAYHEQIKAVESFADSLVEYINQIEADAIQNIAIDWADGKVTVQCDRKKTANAIVQIIDGEGMFQYGTSKAFFYACGKDAIQSHSHYLLNVPLINKIYCMTGKPRFEWDVQSWDIDKDYLADCIEEELAEIVPQAEKRIEKIQKDLQHLTLLTH